MLHIPFIDNFSGRRNVKKQRFSSATRAAGDRHEKAGKVIIQ